MADENNNGKVVEACEKVWDDYKSDCSGFVRAVALELKISVVDGPANDIVDSMATDPWKKLKDGVEAKGKAEEGNFVVAGLKATPNGHVAVVVGGPLNREKYPSGYWGKLGAQGKKNETLNWSWTLTDLPNVTYAYLQILAK
jgi:hypothetical protein